MYRCEVCGERITAKHQPAKRRFCGRECYQIWRKVQRRMKTVYDMEAQRKVNGAGKTRYIFEGGE